MACGSEPSVSALTTGPQGPSGESIQIESIFNCTKISTYFFSYQGVTYSTGDVFVRCEISDNISSFSTSNFYKSTQSGASNYSCVLTFDVDTASAGFWQFTFTSGTKKAVYSDTGSGSNGSTLTYASGDCSTI